MTELKPCCERSVIDIMLDFDGIMIYCLNCGKTVYTKGTNEEGFEAWNRREEVK